LNSAIEEWGREAFLLYLQGGHYAAPIDYSDKVLEQARATVETLRNRLRDGGGGSDPALIAAVCEALDDDFNTPRALALLFDAPAEASGSVAEVLEVLGLGSLAVDDQAPPELDEKRRQRDQARQDGDFARADALRTEIEAAGWEVRDTGGGTVLYPRHG
jgi:cysteinyl-tRNA synthetase